MEERLMTSSQIGIMISIVAYLAIVVIIGVIFSKRTKNVGDQYVEIQIEIPKKLSHEERELYEKLANRKKESVFEKFKKTFK